jgi:hypothetical protein
MFDCDIMQNAFEAAPVAIDSGLARALMYAAECRLAGRSLREHEGRRVVEPVLEQMAKGARL